MTILLIEVVMREILFRGKRTENGEWLEGFYEKTSGRHFIVNGFTNALQYVQKEVIPETIGQYTGLKDKNGKKIFEGDIVQYQPSHMCEPTYSVVEYCADKYNYPAFDLKKHDYEANGLQCAHEEGIGCEVIGNIHDNPELLEAKNERL